MGERNRMREPPSRLLVAFPIVLAIALMPAASPPLGAEVAAPAGERELARVNGEPITLEELLYQLGSLHGDLRKPEGSVQMPDPMELLRRLVDVRLVVQEARNIGLDELPEVRRRIDAGYKELIRQTVIEERVGDIAAGDPAEVDRLYREAVREVEVASVLFPSVEAAEEFRWALADGADFESAADAMVELGTATSREETRYLKAAQLLPQVADVLLGLEIGETSPPIEVAGGVTVARLLDVRYPEDAEARARAEDQALTMRRQAELAKYSQELRSRYASVNRDLVESLDYDSPEPGLEALRQDDRVLVEIRGGDSITVADLTASMEQKFFHGMDRAVEAQRVTEEVPGTLDRLLLERAVLLETERLGLADRPSFRDASRRQEEGLIFGTFVNKVINPKVQLEEPELEAFYSEHRSEFENPTMMRLDNIAFEERAAAEAALERLRRGSDFGWVRDHSRGAAGADVLEKGWVFGGQLLALPTLPSEVQDALAGAAAGDFRFCAQPEGPFHVLRVLEIFASTPKPYEEVKREIAGRVFSRKRQAVLERWTGELMKASEVEFLVDGDELDSLLGLSRGGQA